tara:strand:+ start:264 stop:491 length:228 start_codon:yes stop_codon:yes gene_type:complete
MVTPFESVARAALEEMLRKHFHESKYGYILAKDGMDELVDDLYQFLQTSRSLKDAGDRMIGGMAGPKPRVKGTFG